MMEPLLISIAGIIGVLARYGTSLSMTRWLGTAFPYATVFINVTGSFAIGVVYVLGPEKGLMSQQTARALMVGLLGGYTTFSSFSLETARLLEGGQLGLGLVNIFASVLFCLGGTALGFLVGRNWL